MVEMVETEHVYVPFLTQSKSAPEAPLWKSQLLARICKVRLKHRLPVWMYHILVESISEILERDEVTAHQPLHVTLVKYLRLFTSSQRCP